MNKSKPIQNMIRFSKHPGFGTLNLQERNITVLRTFTLVHRYVTLLAVTLNKGADWV